MLRKACPLLAPAAIRQALLDTTSTELDGLLLAAEGQEPSRVVDGAPHCCLLHSLWRRLLLLSKTTQNVKDLLETSSPHKILEEAQGWRLWSDSAHHCDDSVVAAAHDILASLLAGNSESAGADQAAASYRQAVPLALGRQLMRLSDSDVCTRACGEWMARMAKRVDVARALERAMLALHGPHD